MCKRGFKAEAREEDLRKQHLLLGALWKLSFLEP